MEKLVLKKVVQGHYIAKVDGTEYHVYRVSLIKNVYRWLIYKGLRQEGQYIQTCYTLGEARASLTRMTGLPV